MLRRGGCPCHPQPAVPHGIVDGSAARQGYRGPRKMKPKPRALVPRAIAPRRPAAVLSAMVGLVLAAAALAGEASPWFQGHHSRARLVAGGADGAARLAAIEIALDRGFKTYWRHPGESGLPPAFDWSASENVAMAEVLWPAPTRFEDAGGVSYGYANGVVFPVRFTRGDPGKPVHLVLKLDYGVCKDICIPAHAELALAPSDRDAAPERALIEEAMARVPKPTPIRANQVFAINNVEPNQGIRDQLVLTAYTPKGAAPRLFVEAPEGWYFGDAEPMKLINGADYAFGTYIVRILERPRELPAKIELRLTLVADHAAIETTALLDTAALAR